ncbi:MAG: pyruvate:ferredoxin (flavodoxin) oxidoreductase [Kiritimatiellaeota bacterium]|nr:pyruvate:ferredoxin (flavodoxin) oxidoreductase [Kiritimatiellota bacterium]
MAKKIMVDGNEAVAAIAHLCSEVCAIYPITPSSNMGEWADEWSAKGRKNLWGTVPQVVEMQSEGGAVGAVHGALACGALSSTFTASQGLLLMIPNMYKIAGELIPTVFHVSARALAYQGLSIFGDHSDVYSTRQTGFAMLASGSVQETMDLATIAHAATLESRIPFLHFFDGFRTSHEVQKIDEVGTEVVREMIDDDFVFAHRARALSPDHPTMRGTAQNPDVYFQGRETCNPFYNATPGIVQAQMDKFAKLTGRQYRLFDYYGAPDAEHIIVIMGSGAETVQETVDAFHKAWCTDKSVPKVGVVKVRLYRPFDVKAFAQALPGTVKTISVLDRTKEPGALGDPLYLDIRTAVGEAMEEKSVAFAKYPRILAGRYALASKEFTPAVVKSVFDNAASASPKNHFTVGINDDVTHTNLPAPEASFVIDHPGRKECMFYGLGSDGTVGANKNSIKIIGEETDNNVQAYFVYDSKKAGVMTVSHLRFGKEPIQSPYLCTNADFIACHNFSFCEKYDMLSNLKEGGVFLLSCPYAPEEVWNHLPDELEAQIIAKKAKFYVVDALPVAEKLGLGSRINTIMQTAFFKISGILPEDEAIEYLKKAAKKAYGRKGDDVVKKNWDAIDAARDAVKEVSYPAKPAGKFKMPSIVSADSTPFVKEVTAQILAQKGDSLPVSAIPNDGTWPTATSQYEKRNIATTIPEWDATTCIQCGQCSLVCPHAAIRMKIYAPEALAKAPAAFKRCDAKTPAFAGKQFTLQCAPEDCVSCGACVHKCPMKAKGALKMVDQIPLREQEAANFAFFLSLPETDTANVNVASVKGSQLRRPLFEFSGACAGCGETPYIKLLTQLFGDRMVIANATGCSSIYGGNLPTTPYCTNADGKGPAWANSLFEDNAEFGMGMRLTCDKQKEFATEICKKFIAENQGPPDFLAACKEAVCAVQKTDADIAAQRARVAKIKGDLDAFIKETGGCAESKALFSIADSLVDRSVWIVGGDGWAYDIGYGGLDHVLASGSNINILVMDTEVYSNTGGQASKATPLGAVAKFAANGKRIGKKDLGMISMTYGGIYVAQVAMGANPEQVVKAFVEAEAYNGPSLIIAYSHCIAHGIAMETGMNNQKMAVETGHFPLYRFNPVLAADGKNPLTLDSKPPTVAFQEQAKAETRFKQLASLAPADAEALFAEADKAYRAKYDLLAKLAALA